MGKGTSPVSRREAPGLAPSSTPISSPQYRSERGGRKGVVNSHVFSTASGDSISSLFGHLRGWGGMGDAGGIRGSPGISLHSVGMEINQGGFSGLNIAFRENCYSTHSLGATVLGVPRWVAAVPRSPQSTPVEPA